MNIHHLELFYYVAKHKGISEAVRRMPYGIQQPAFSAQILALEEQLGSRLFQRRPFELTDSGLKLFQFVSPFFDNLETAEHEISRGPSQMLRIGAADVVLNKYLPKVLRQVRASFPSLKISLKAAFQPQLEEWLQKNEIDVAITVLNRKPAVGIRCHQLLEIPIILLVAKSSGIKDTSQLWQCDRLPHPLISLPANEPVTQNFQAGLARARVTWTASIEVSSIDLIQTYVSEGYGVGLSVGLPGAKLPSGIQALPLPDVEPLAIGLMWRQNTPLVDAFIHESKKIAAALSASPCLK